MDPLLLLSAEQEMLRALLEMLIEGPKNGVERKRLLLSRVAEVFDFNNVATVRLLHLASSKHGMKLSDRMIVIACIDLRRIIHTSLLPDVLSIDLESPLFERRLHVLSEYANKLFNDEEEKIFPLLPALLSSREIDEMSTFIEARTPFDRVLTDDKNLSAKAD
jgi:hypothetical protein